MNTMGVTKIEISVFNITTFTVIHTLFM